MVTRSATFVLVLLWSGSALAQPWNPPAPPPPSTPLPRAPAPPTLVLDENPAPGRVLLRLRSPSRPQHVVIESRAPAPANERPGVVTRAAGGCNTPCQLWVPRGTLRMRSSAPGLRQSEFDIDVDAATSLEVRAPSSALFNVGTGLAAVGATVLVATLTVALAQQAEGVPPSDQIQPTVAVGVSLLGALLLGGGVPLLITNRTGYRQVALSER